MSFQQGLSGLSAAATQLDVIGNNVANANTVGFKAGQAQFADVYANALGGGGGSDVGIGVTVSQVKQQFTQGNVSSTNNPLDIAINGNGFFRTSDNGVISYTRNGQFTLNKEGYIVNASGDRLTGFAVDASGKVAAGSAVELQVSASDIAPKITTEVITKLNLDSTKTAIDTALHPFDPDDPDSYTNATTVTVYDTLGNPHNLQTFYVKTAANNWNVFASVDGALVGEVAGVPVTTVGVAGTDTVVSGGVPAFVAPATAFTDIPAGSFSINGVNIGAITAGVATVGPPPLTAQQNQALNVAAAINSANIPGVTANGSSGSVVITNANDGDVAIGSNGSALNGAAAIANVAALQAQTGLTIGTQSVVPTIGALAFDSYGALTNTNPRSVAVTVGTGAVTPFTVQIDYTGTTQYGSKFSINTQTQDGYASGRLASFAVEADGTLMGRYTNGKTATLGQLVLANFANPNGLQPLGNNMYAETVTSGQPLVGTPDSGSLGVLQSYAVEDSNVDLTAELVNMITAQRYYQANAQTIKTQDAVMQTLVSLR